MTWNLTQHGFSIEGKLEVPGEHEGTSIRIDGEYLDDLIRDRYALNGETTKPLKLERVKITVEYLGQSG